MLVRMEEAEPPHIYIPLSLGGQPQPVLLSVRCRVTELPFFPTKEMGMFLER